MATIHVVMRSTGEYSDRSDSPICAYEDEALARQHVEAADRRAREIEGAIRDEKRGGEYADNDVEFQRLLRSYFDKDPSYDDARYEELSAWSDKAGERFCAMRASNEFDPGCQDWDCRTYFLYSVDVRDALPVASAAEVPK